MTCRRVGAIAVLSFLLAGCLATRSLDQKVEMGFGTLSPLASERAWLVRITPDAAATTVLTHERETGWPDDDIDWEDGHCVLGAWFERHPMSRAPDPDPPTAVYLVRLVDGSGSKGTWVMVDATSGEIGAAFEIGAAIGAPLQSGCT